MTNVDLDQYAEQGYVVLRNAFSAEDVQGLLAETATICRGERGAVGGLEPASPDLSDEEAMRRYVAINFPHKISKVLRDAMRQPSVVSALTRVIGPNVKAMQSMLYMKSEGKAGQAWHQDEHFIPTRDRSLTGVWIALDDAAVDNGCLWVLPGSHRAGVLYPDREHDDPRFDCAIEAYDFPYSQNDAVPVELDAGSVVVFNGYLLHLSLPNTRPGGFRRALVNHYMSAESLLPWRGPLPEGVHIGKYDHRDIMLVAGHDPYAYKGTPDIVHPYLRKDRDGGCDR
ncbi:phytanoyl-CoA dioxygenase family protein [Allokutzneria sp. A3M-2-11 16]|uniref:phytanoyl-CoA dioxygenase family protein n=1 Tax=Allokutzneria sp. A3M-2-11 16 TaxID=2962043 RepID=UPI0020B8625A|nr:phytanoyl-CoA dioxygenase family protein [Allokutzneria sp. A3M-2-11 16]MCP3805126.1 phytanoyl-CoA dioxygenase family protein [Allokutzneria sp. A3M-2-11 16]